MGEEKGSIASTREREAVSTSRIITSKLQRSTAQFASFGVVGDLSDGTVVQTTMYTFWSTLCVTFFINILRHCGFLGTLLFGALFWVGVWDYFRVFFCFFFWDLFGTGLRLSLLSLVSRSWLLGSRGLYFVAIIFLSFLD